MNTEQIDSILRKDEYCGQLFKGVFARDQFVSARITFPGIYVCNTDKMTQPGMHWVAVYFDNKGKCDYFDSYGLPPLFNDLNHKIMSLDKYYVYNNNRIQSFDTNTCGIYCVLYALMRSRGETLSETISTFLLVNTTHERDHVVKYFYDHNFNHFYSDSIHVI